jgi:hypothetical protein
MNSRIHRKEPKQTRLFSDDRGRYIDFPTFRFRPLFPLTDDQQREWQRKADEEGIEAVSVEFVLSMAGMLSPLGGDCEYGAGLPRGAI